jgi:L-malate glycosyltransferase
VIGAIGRLHREKGMDILVRSFSHLAGDFPDLKLVIIGDGPEKENLRELVSRMNLSERVIFAGFLPEPEKYIPLFEAFVLPSRIEAMPIALMQAMAAGKAIVATNVGGVSELIADNQTGFLVPVEDEFLMTRAISRILRDPALSKKMGQAAKEKAAGEFSRDKMVDSYRRLYQSAVEGKI